MRGRHLLLMEWLVAAGALLLAFVNGANDNMKGVATLYGSGALDYRSALGLATLSTGLGSLASTVLAAGLLKAFSAKGLVPDAASSPELLAAVAVAAATTVLLATRVGLPVSTTHALVGALVGAGAFAAGSGLELSALGKTFLLPLVAGPLLGVALAFGLDQLGRTMAKQGVRRETCVCVEESAPLIEAGGAAVLTNSRLSLVVAHRDACTAGREARLPGFELGRVVEWGHLLSAGTVGFARGLNDTPKILGLVVGADLVSPTLGACALGAAMALGGLAAARRVAETLAKKLTPMSPAQGFSANAATSLLVVAASYLSLPVSTTHVSTGGIFGIGASCGGLRGRMATEIVLAWLVTLPLAGLLGLVSMWALQ